MIGKITVRRDEVTVEPDPSAKLTKADLEAAYQWAVNIARLMGWAKIGARPETDAIDEIAHG